MHSNILVRERLLCAVAGVALYKPDHSYQNEQQIPQRMRVLWTELGGVTACTSGPGHSKKRSRCWRHTADKFCRVARIFIPRWVIGLFLVPWLMSPASPKSEVSRSSPTKSASADSPPGARSSPLRSPVASTP